MTGRPVIDDGLQPVPPAKPDLVLNRRAARAFVVRHGWEEFIDALEDRAIALYGGAYGFHSLGSKSWLDDDDETTFLAKGAVDLLVGFDPHGYVLRKQRSSRKRWPDAATDSSGAQLYLVLNEEGGDR